MTGNRPSDDLLRQEVDELTHLMRTDDGFAHIHAALTSKGVNPSETILAGLIEGEDETSYGVVLTPSRECIRFEISPNGSVAMWDVVADPNTLVSAFQAIFVGIEKMNDGGISLFSPGGPASEPTPGSCGDGVAEPCVECLL